MTVSFLMLGALMASVTFNIKLATSNKGKLGASAIMNRELESIRAMKYSDVGILNGNPSGILKSSDTEIFNNITYTIDRFVYWVDNDKDGLDVSDTDGNPNDFKQARIKISWMLRGATSSIESFTYVYGNQ